MSNTANSLLKYDQENIFEEQKKTLEFLFDTIDMSKFAFVGGVADYINLRQYYKMPINDLDIVYENDIDIEQVAKVLNLESFKSSFYKKINDTVLISEFKVGNKYVHIDFYKRDFSVLRLQQSELIGKVVWHTSFKEMQRFHNSQIPQLTSEAMGNKYDWKRLYKHSKKASLYNNIIFLKEKNLIGALKLNV
jgi:hypothetical protein